MSKRTSRPSESLNVNKKKLQSRKEEGWYLNINVLRIWCHFSVFSSPVHSFVCHMNEDMHALCLNLPAFMSKFCSRRVDIFLNTVTFSLGKVLIQYLGSKGSKFIALSVITLFFQDLLPVWRESSMLDNIWILHKNSFCLHFTWAGEQS